MKADPETRGGISVGGNVSGSALSTGNKNTQTVTYTTTEGSGQDTAAVLEALREIRAALDGLSGPYVKPAQANTDTAITEVSGEQVNKDAVGGAIETALEAAKKSADFISVAAKIGPYVKTIAGWLGDSWSHLSNILQ